MDRRKFLKTSAAVVAGASLAMGMNKSLMAQTGAPMEAAPAAIPQWKLRPLGKTGLQVAPVSFGAMNTMDEGLVRHVIEKGINYIDTARSYGRGQNEEIIGKVVKDFRDKVFVATKASPKSGAAVMASCDTSLEKLGMERVDVFMLHGVRNRQQALNEDFTKALDQLKQAGKIRFAGMSTHSNMAEVITAAIEGKFYDMVQATYRVGLETDMDPVIEKAAQAGIGIVAMKTQVGARRRRGDETPPPTHLSLLKGVLKNPNVSCAVPGMTAYQQVDEAVTAMETAFDWEDRKRVVEHLAAVDRNLCRMCGRCDGVCPRGVAVGEVERCLMYAEGYKDMSLGRAEYLSLGAGARAASCAECGRCVVKCAHRLAIREHMLRAHSILA